MVAGHSAMERPYRQPFLYHEHRRVSLHCQDGALSSCHIVSAPQWVQEQVAWEETGPMMERQVRWVEVLRALRLPGSPYGCAFEGLGLTPRASVEFVLASQLPLFAPARFSVGGPPLSSPSLYVAASQPDLHSVRQAAQDRRVQPVEGRAPLHDWLHGWAPR